MTRRAVIVEAATALTRQCPTCSVPPKAACKRPNGKPFRSKHGSVHARRTYLPKPLSHYAVTTAGHGHVRNALHGSSAICGVAVTLENVERVRVSCVDCYSTRAHLLSHPSTSVAGVRLLPAGGGVPDDATV